MNNINTLITETKNQLIKDIERLKLKKSSLIKQKAGFEELLVAKTDEIQAFEQRAKEEVSKFNKVVAALNKIDIELIAQYDVSVVDKIYDEIFTKYDVNWLSIEEAIRIWGTNPKPNMKRFLSFANIPQFRALKKPIKTELESNITTLDKELLEVEKSLDRAKAQLNSQDKLITQAKKQAEDGYRQEFNNLYNDKVEFFSDDSGDAFISLVEAETGKAVDVKKKDACNAYVAFKIALETDSNATYLYEL